jgi:outer membrane protein assembly factor BamB
MRSFEIFVAPQLETPRFDPESPSSPSSPSRPLAEADDRGGASRPRLALAARPAPRSAAREALDVFVDGANLTSRFTERDATCVLRDLALALVQLAKQPRGKAIVHFNEDAWELAVERAGGRGWISVYRGGPSPQITAYDRPVLFADVVASVREAAELARLRHPRDLDLREACAALSTLGSVEAVDAAGTVGTCDVHLDIVEDAGLSLGCEFIVRQGRELPDAGEVERADLHALLFRGKLRASARGREVTLGIGHPFLFAERFLDLAARALDTAEREEDVNLRFEGGGVVMGIRSSSTAEGEHAVALSFGEPGASGSCTFPSLRASDVLDAAITFGQRLVRALVRHDRAQAGNLRLGSFRRRLRDLLHAFHESRLEDVKVNPRPEAYRPGRAAPPMARPVGSSADEAASASTHAPAPARLRYSPRWRALVPGIDLRGTFLFGDRLLVGAASESFCLDRATGDVEWRVPTTRATSVLTPGGVARLHADGQVHLHDFGNGEITMRAEVGPRIGAPPAGVVVHGAGLPRLLVVTEGERHLVALDLAHGQARWRAPYTASSRRVTGAPRPLRLKRFGRLLFVTAGDSALTALDAVHGSVVWRTRDPLRFRGPVTLGHDVLYAVAGGARGRARLHAIDPYSGEVRWVAEIPKAGATGTRDTQGSDRTLIDGAPILAGDVVTVAVRDRQGSNLVAFDRDTGELCWRSSAPLAPASSSWLGIDDLFIGNAETGDLVGVEAASGKVRYRHVLGRSVEGDGPRRLEPVLRSGALFVPHTDVHVFRPRDGAPLGTIGPCDAIPDLLRVDDRCDVYIAEESGHLVSFGAGPRLSLVR